MSKAPRPDRAWRHYVVAASMAKGGLPDEVLARISRRESAMMIGRMRTRYAKAIGLYIAGLERIAADPAHRGRERAADILCDLRVEAAAASVH